MSVDRTYDIKVTKGGYILVRILKNVSIEQMRVLSDETVALHKETGIDKVLCDIRALEGLEGGIAQEAEGMAILWKMRFLKRAAFVVKGEFNQKSLSSALKMTHLNTKFQLFQSEAEAVTWLLS